MSSIKNVAVTGASGNLGVPVVEALLSSGFTVTALTRADSTSTFPPGVRVQKVDYDSAPSLEEALKGQDAVVSTIATAALAQQQKLVDAAVSAGVQRFIPSEFGINTTNLSGGVAKILGFKVKTQEQLKRATSENPNFSWTGVSTSLFFDWGLKKGSLAVSIPTKTATIYDSGDEKFTATNLPTIGLAVAAILKDPAGTKNRYLDIASFTTTQNEILGILEEETGEKWTVKRATTEDSERVADEKLEKGDYSAFGDYLKVFLFRDGKGGSPKRLANEELGLGNEDLRKTIKAALG